MKIKGNEDLFERWRCLGSRIMELGYIIQNDMDIPKTRVIGWQETTRVFREEYNLLVEATFQHLDREDNKCVG